MIIRDERQKGDQFIYSQTMRIYIISYTKTIHTLRESSVDSYFHIICNSNYICEGWKCRGKKYVLIRKNSFSLQQSKKEYKTCKYYFKNKH